MPHRRTQSLSAAREAMNNLARTVTTQSLRRASERRAANNAARAIAERRAASVAARNARAARRAAAQAPPVIPRRRRNNALTKLRLEHQENLIKLRTELARQHARALNERQAAVRENAGRQANRRISENYKRKLLKVINVTKRLVTDLSGQNYNNVLQKVKNFAATANQGNLKTKSKAIFNSYNLVPNSARLTPAQKQYIIRILQEANNWKKIPNGLKRNLKSELYTPHNQNTKLMLLGSILDLVSIYSQQHANALQNAAENYGIKQQLKTMRGGRFLGWSGLGRRFGKGQARELIGGARAAAKARREAPN